MSEAEIGVFIIMGAVILFAFGVVVWIANTRRSDEIDGKVMERDLEDFRTDEARRKRRAQRNLDT